MLIPPVCEIILLIITAVKNFGYVLIEIRMILARFLVKYNNPNTDNGGICNE